MTRWLGRLIGVLALCLPAQALRADQTLTLGTLKYGTVNWELETIRAEGFDHARGFDLQVRGFAGEQAARVAFLAGELDAIVADWIWAARMRAAGTDLVVLPYSRAVGGVVVAGGSDARDLRDLAGARIGIAGGPLDKSWLILRAYAAQSLDFDLAASTTQVFGAPPLISEAARRGDTGATISFWHYLARMQAEGFRSLITVETAARALGLDPQTPLLGYVVSGALARENPRLVAALAEASRDAKTLLASDDSAWERLRPMMKAPDPGTFDALRAGFRAGIPADAPVDLAAADRLLAVMAQYGGAALVGQADRLPDGLFLATR
ncbi:MAG: ABC transporter substrate-binding protein [Rhodobacteraceae bacterium]|nr:ABC transporter substrate-binding protein [Paracoccaceae bacterium]